MARQSAAAANISGLVQAISALTAKVNALSNNQAAVRKAAKAEPEPEAPATLTKADKKKWRAKVGKVFQYSAQVWAQEHNKTGDAAGYKKAHTAFCKKNNKPALFG